MYARTKITWTEKGSLSNNVKMIPQKKFFIPPTQRVCSKKVSGLFIIFKQQKKDTKFVVGFFLSNKAAVKIHLHAKLCPRNIT